MNKRNKTFAGLEESPFYGLGGSTFLHVNILARPAGSKRRRDIRRMHKHRWLGEGKGNLWGVRRGEGGGGGGVALLLEDIFPGFPSKIGELLITYSFLLSKLSGFTVNQCFEAKIIFFPLMISFHGLRDSFFLNIIVIGSLTNLRLSCCLSHNFMIWLQ